MGASIRTIVLSVAAPVLLAACQTTKPPSTPLPSTPVAQPAPDNAGRDLIGAWALNPTECASDNGLVYKADGEWFSYGAYGTWSVSGPRLTSLVTHRGEGLGEEKPVVPPERDVTTIISLSATRLVTRSADGAERTLVRCPQTPEG